MKNKQNLENIGNIEDDLIVKGDYVREQDDTKEIIKFLKFSYGEDSE